MNRFKAATAYSYLEYRKIITEDLALQIEINNPDEAEIVNYTKLNQSRMNRLDKTMQIDTNLKNMLQNLASTYTFYVISEGWCGDAAQLLPIINKITEATSNITLKIIFRDQNLEIMDQYLTNGSRSIPKLVIYNEKEEEIATWGPRPAEATQLVIDLKNQYGGITEEVKEGLQKWYNQDKGITTQNEIIALLK